MAPSSPPPPRTMAPLVQPSAPPLEPGVTPPLLDSPLDQALNDDDDDDDTHEAAVRRLSLATFAAEEHRRAETKAHVDAQEDAGLAAALQASREAHAADQRARAIQEREELERAILLSQLEAMAVPHIHIPLAAVPPAAPAHQPTARLPSYDEIDHSRAPEPVMPPVASDIASALWRQQVDPAMQPGVLTFERQPKEPVAERQPKQPEQQRPPLVVEREPAAEAPAAQRLPRPTLPGDLHRDLPSPTTSVFVRPARDEASAAVTVHRPPALAVVAPTPPPASDHVPYAEARPPARPPADRDPEHTPEPSFESDYSARSGQTHERVTMYWSSHAPPAATPAPQPDGAPPAAAPQPARTGRFVREQPLRGRNAASVPEPYRPYK